MNAAALCRYERGKIMAIGTIVESIFGDTGSIRTLKFVCTAASSDGSFPSHALNNLNIEGTLLQIETNPGSPAPADNYDIYLNTADGIDLLQGCGVNRDTSNSECAAIVFGTNYKRSAIDDSDVLTLVVSGSTVGGAKTEIKIKYALGAIS